MVTALIAVLMLGAAPQAGSFSVLGPDGQPVQGSRVLEGERKLIVYVSPSLEPSGRLVEAIEAWSRTSPASWRDRLVIVVAAPLAEARAWLQAHWGADGLPTWFADADSGGWHALGFDGTLGIAGAARGSVEWKLDGVIGDPAVLEPTVRAWIEGAAQ